MRNTLGIAASMASGVRENFGTSTKSVHIGKTAGDGVLAAGEERAASGEEVLKAFILATEVECKIGRICAAELHRRGWHASSITGVLGAAAGAGYLYGQDSTAMSVPQKRQPFR